MAVTRLFESGSTSVIDYRCEATPHDKPFAEHYSAFSLSFVRKGSFTCLSRGRTGELVAGAFLVGYPGDEYTCSHDHHAGGDECLSFQWTAEAVDRVGASRHWQSMSVPPVAELMVVGELAQATAEGKSDFSLDEIGVRLMLRYAELVSDVKWATGKVQAHTCRRMIDAATRIRECSHQPLSLDVMASWTDLSSFHFLRSFTKVLGLTPHQYLIRCRLRNAARLLSDRDRPITQIALDVGFDDLSNFVRTFHRAAGVSPRDFRSLAKADQESSAVAGRLALASRGA